MTHGSLFSGIGGFDLAAEWMGWENKFHCEWNEFGQKVLHHYWPEAELFKDITKSDFKKYNGTIDIISGGFPCQPFSNAGSRKGTDDSRYLWPEMLRCIREICPRWIVGENVYGIVNWDGGVVFDKVCTDLENEGYKVIPIVLPAASVNAPHKRDRVWFVAYFQNKFGRKIDNYEMFQYATNSESQRYEPLNKNRAAIFQTQKKSLLHGGSSNCFDKPKSWGSFPTISPVCDGDDGLSERLDNITFYKWKKESIKAGGNAIVPQVVYQIFKAIEEYDYKFRL